MSNENISIKITDEVDPAISANIKNIAEQSKTAYTGIEKLQTALKGISGSVGLQKLQTELSKTGLAQQKLTTELNKTNEAYFKSEAALSQAIAAELKAAIATEQLTAAQNNAALSAQKLAAAQAKIEESAIASAEASAQKKIAMQRASIAIDENLRAKNAAEYENWWQKQLSIQERGEAKKIALQRNSIAIEERLEKQRLAEIEKASHDSMTKLAQFKEGFQSAFDPHNIGMIAGMAVAFGSVAAAVEGLKSSVQAALDMQTIRQQLDFASGSAKQGAIDFEFLREESVRLGFDLKASAQEFGLLSAAAKGTSSEGKVTKDVFSGLSEAFVTLHLNSEQTARGLYAVQEMMTMGTVQTRQLRMLSLALPGAFHLAADAMGVTTEELMKMMKAGKVITDDFMPKFADQLHKTYGKAAVDASTNARQSIQKLNNEIFLGMAAVGESFLNAYGMAARAVLKLADSYDAARVAARAASKEEFIKKSLAGEFANFGESVAKTNDKLNSFMTLWEKLAKKDMPAPKEKLTDLQIEHALELQDQIEAAKFDAIQDGLNKQLKLEDVRYSKEKIKAGQSHKELELQYQLHLAKINAIRSNFQNSGIGKTDTKLSDELSRMFVLPQAREAQAKYDKIVEESSANKRKLSDAEKASIMEKVKAIQAATEVQKQFDSIYNEAIGPSLIYNSTIEAANKLLQQGAINQEQYKRAITKASESYKNFIDPLRQYNKDLNDQFELLKLLPKEREIEQKLIEEKNKKLTEGIVLDAQQIASIKERLELLQEQKGVSQELDRIYGETKGAMLSLMQQADATNQAYHKGVIGFDDYSNRLVKLSIDIANLKLQMGDGSFIDFITSSLGTMVTQYKGAFSELAGVTGGFFQNITDGFANAEGHAIAYGENLKDVGDVLKKMARDAVASLISALIKLGIQFAINAAIGKTTEGAALAAHTAMSTAAAVSTAVAWAPAAALVSLASFGANSAPAAAGLTATTSLSESLALTSLAGFMDGGWTGNMARDQIAGVVHGREYVLDEATTSRVGVENLIALQNGAASVQRNNSNYSENIGGGDINHNGPVVIQVTTQGGGKADGTAVGEAASISYHKTMRNLRRVERDATFNGFKANP